MFKLEDMAPVCIVSCCRCCCCRLTLLHATRPSAEPAAERSMGETIVLGTLFGAWYLANM